MILLISDVLSPRLEYICHFLFKEQLGVEYELLTPEQFAEKKSVGAALIGYGTERRHPNALYIRATGLLAERGVRPVTPSAAQTNLYPVLFPTNVDDTGFDLFSALFFLITRYEEYLPYNPDLYGRFPHTASIAYREQFLDMPLANLWIGRFAEALQRAFPALTLYRPQARSRVTYDIDMAWSYRHKGLWRQVGGWLRKPGLARIRVCLGQEKDPYDCHNELLAQLKDLGARVTVFFPMARKRGRFDKNISPRVPALRSLVKRYGDLFSCGLHPSWASFDHPERLAQEKNELEQILNRPVTAARRHYIRMKLPDSFRELLQAGFTDDFSMGYGSINGFRASFAGSFYWYDLLNETPTALRIHTFCFMDANSHFEQHHSVPEAREELKRMESVCAQNQGTLTTVFHNHLLGTEPEFAGWSDLHADFISRIR